MSRSLALFAALAACVVCPAQVLQVRLGVHSTCPDGLPGCWGGPYQALCMLKGITVEKKPDFQTWMVKATIADDQFPDMAVIDKQVRAAGQFFYVRGFEVTVQGAVKRVGGKMMIAVPGCKDMVQLVQAKKSHEWNPIEKEERPLRPDEQEAFTKLSGAFTAGQPMVVVGWLDQAPDKTLSIEVIGSGPAPKPAPKSR